MHFLCNWKKKGKIMAEQLTNADIQPPETPRRKRSWCGLFLFLLMLIILAAGIYGYICLHKRNIALNHQLTELKQQSQADRENFTSIQSTLKDVQEGTQKARDLADQQEQMMADWKATQKGDLQKWYVAEAQYLVKLANDQLQYTHDTQMALNLLQRADQVLKNVDAANVEAIRKSLANDIASVQGDPQTNLTNLYLRLNNLNSQIDKLPLPALPLPDAKQKEINVDGLPWWKAGLKRSWETLRHIVIVKNTANTLPLVLPDEKLFLYQNLHAQLETAMWAVLHRNVDVYNTSLDRAIDWVQLYFAQDDEQTKTTLQTLQELRKTDISVPKTDLTQTLQLLTDYFGQSGSTQ
jgi:uroporphyrin-3 C-methyltransferase